MRRWTIRTATLIGVTTLAAVSLRDRLPAPKEFVDVLRDAHPGWVLLAAAAQVVSLELFSRQQRTLLRCFGVGLTPDRSRAITYARAAISIVLPAGSVVSAAFAYRQWTARGASPAVAGTVMLLSGLVSVAGLVALYLAGSGLAAVWASPGARLGSAPLLYAVALLFVAVAARAAWTRAARWAAQPGPTAGDSRLDRIRSSAARAMFDLSTMPRRGAASALALAAGNWLTDLACLVFAIRAFNISVGVVSVAGLYLAVQLLRQAPLTPGGVGLIEAALISGLVAAGVDDLAAGAAAFTYRLFAFWALIPIGAAGWAALQWHRAGGAPGVRVGLPRCGRATPAHNRYRADRVVGSATGREVVRASRVQS